MKKSLLALAVMCAALALPGAAYADPPTARASPAEVKAEAKAVHAVQVQREAQSPYLFTIYEPAPVLGLSSPIGKVEPTCSGKQAPMKPGAPPGKGGGKKKCISASASSPPSTA